MAFLHLFPLTFKWKLFIKFPDLMRRKLFGQATQLNMISLILENLPRFFRRLVSEDFSSRVRLTGRPVMRKLPAKDFWQGSTLHSMFKSVKGLGFDAKNHISEF